MSQIGWARREMPVNLRVGIVVRAVCVAAVMSAVGAARVSAQAAAEPVEPQNAVQQNTVTCTCGRPA